MEVLFEKEGHSIFTFKTGDIIIRLKPMQRVEQLYNENLGISVEVEQGTDNSYRYPMELIAIENNLIYLKSVGKAIITSPSPFSILNLEQWSEDWALFVVPNGLALEDC